jgi:hypothetical protein
MRLRNPSLTRRWIADLVKPTIVYWLGLSARSFNPVDPPALLPSAVETLRHVPASVGRYFVAQAMKRMRNYMVTPGIAQCPSGTKLE